MNQSNDPDYDKTHPIYGTDFSKPTHEIIEELRNQITRIRGQLGDIGRAYPHWKDRVESVEGLLTCGLVSLYYIKEEMKDHRLLYGGD